MALVLPLRVGSPFGIPLSHDGLVALPNTLEPDSAASESEELGVYLEQGSAAAIPVEDTVPNKREAAIAPTVNAAEAGRR